MLTFWPIHVHNSIICSNRTVAFTKEMLSTKVIKDSNTIGENLKKSLKAFWFDHNLIIVFCARG